MTKKPTTLAERIAKARAEMAEWSVERLRGLYLDNELTPADTAWNQQVSKLIAQRKKSAP